MKAVHRPGARRHHQGRDRRAVHRRRQYRHRRLRPRAGDGDAGARALHAARPARCTTSPMSTARICTTRSSGSIPKRTMFIVASKTFTTDETMTNAAIGARLDRRRARRSGGATTISRRSRPISRPAPRSASAPTASSGSGTGSAAAIRCGRPSACRSRSPSASTISRRSSRAPTRWTSISSRRRLEKNLPVIMGAAGRLVSQRLGLLDPCGAALRPAAQPLSGLSAAAGHGEQRQVGDARRASRSTTTAGRSSGASRAPTASTPSTS